MSGHQMNELDNKSQCYTATLSYSWWVQGLGVWPYASLHTQTHT